MDSQRSKKSVEWAGSRARCALDDLTVMASATAKTGSRVSVITQPNASALAEEYRSQTECFATALQLSIDRDTSGVCSTLNEFGDTHDVTQVRKLVAVITLTYLRYMLHRYGGTSILRPGYSLN